MERQLGEIERRQQAKADAGKGNVVPFIKGIKMMSAREADECAEHGEALRWIEDSERHYSRVIRKSAWKFREDCSEVF
jgi:hypothetical protein